MADRTTPPSEASNKRLLYHIALGLFVMISPLIQLAEIQAISWIGIGAGILAVLLSYAFSRTSLGNAVDEWFHQIELGGRVVIIIIAVPVILGGFWLLRPPEVPTLSFLIGGMSTLVLATIIRILNRFSRREQQHPA